MNAPGPSSAGFDPSLAAIFRALGDPVRLEMVRRLSTGKPTTIAGLTQGLGVTRQGARKHLQVLADTSLAVLQPKGRDVQVQLAPETLERARAFIFDMESRWDSRLQTLKKLLESDGDRPGA